MDAVVLLSLQEAQSCGHPLVDCREGWGVLAVDGGAAGMMISIRLKIRNKATGNDDEQARQEKRQDPFGHVTFRFLDSIVTPNTLSFVRT